MNLSGKEILKYIGGLVCIFGTFYMFGVLVLPFVPHHIIVTAALTVTAVVAVISLIVIFMLTYAFNREDDGNNFWL